MIAGVDNKWVEMPKQGTKNKRQQVSGEDIDEETKEDVEVTFEDVDEKTTEHGVMYVTKPPKKKRRKRTAQE